MNKLLLVLIAVVILIAGSVIGGLFYFGFLGNVELNNYTGNGVSFKYPAEYNLIEVNDNSTFIIGKNTKNPGQTFYISKSPVNGEIYHGMSLDESANTLINDFKSRGWIVILTTNTTHHADNSSKEVQAYSISYSEKLPSQSDSNSVNGHILMFDKDANRYTIDFQGKGKEKYDARARIHVDTSFKVL